MSVARISKCQAVADVWCCHSLGPKLPICLFGMMTFLNLLLQSLDFGPSSILHPNSLASLLTKCRRCKTIVQDAFEFAALLSALMAAP